MEDINLIYKCVIGSRAYGLDNPDSDWDYRGICLTAPEDFWRFGKPLEQIEKLEGSEDIVYYELGKFCKLALKANPNILECLFSPKSLLSTPVADELLGRKYDFLSKRIYHTYRGYAFSQIKKIARYIRTEGKVRWKHPMHVLRLLISATHAAKHGEILVDVGEHRQYLLDIREGKLSLEEIEEEYEAWFERFDQAFEKTELPEEPPTKEIEDWLVDVRHRQLAGNL